jgi:hypothetical protein
MPEIRRETRLPQVHFPQVHFPQVHFPQMRPLQTRIR